MLNDAPANNPDYAGLIRFLLEPFLDAPEALRVDCEVIPGKKRVWIRVAFDGTDKGRVFGRGGRNIQAIRAVLNASATMVGYSAHLDIYGGQPSTSDRDGDDSSSDRRIPRSSPPRLPRRDRPSRTHSPES
ncbi:MAG: KH domain-containing protein [Coleofasciculaceae cyanobacterium SM2_3_26]|nr:KH domain-containing protein [Coleofasciculaceae cyanobacterium SM2_3_26]